MRDVYMVMANWAGSVFVKQIDFFRDQGGFTEDWGLGWVPVVAESVEEARQKGCKLLPEARPYECQAVSSDQRKAREIISLIHPEFNDD